MKNFTESELKQHVSHAVAAIKNLLNSFIISNPKRAALLGYWLEDYSSYLSDEDTYTVQKYKYNRGDIIQVNFGYRIGHELGGRHFAVVVDNNNSISGGTVAVVPLTSQKPTSKANRYCFLMKHGLYDLQNKKMEKLNTQINTLQDDIHTLTVNAPPGKEDRDLLKNKLSKLKNEQSELEVLMKSISKLKKGSIINVGQITTISKMRIINPKMHKDSLNGIKLTPEDLDKLNEKLKDLYLK